MTPGVGKRRRWRRRSDNDEVPTADYECSAGRGRYAANEIDCGYRTKRRRRQPTSHSKSVYKAKRADGDTTVKWSDVPASEWTSGAWSPAASPPSCATNGAISTISIGSKMTYQFYGTSITVNIVKSSSGAPYIVTLDGEETSWDSGSDQDTCAADFNKSGLPKKLHTVVLQHNGTSQLAASGRSTLTFQSLVYTPFDPSEASDGVSSVDVPAIVGGVLGAVTFLVVASFVYWIWKRRNSANDKATASQFSQDLNTTHRGSSSRNSHITPYIAPPANTSHHYSRKQALDSQTSNPWASTDPGPNLSSNSRGASTGGRLGAAGSGSGSGSGSGGASGSQLRAAKPRALGPSSTPTPPSTTRPPPPQAPHQPNLFAPSAQRASNWVPAEDDFSPEGHDRRSSSYSLADLSRPRGESMAPPPSYDTISRAPAGSPPLSNLSAHTSASASSTRRLLPDPGHADAQGQLSAADVDTIARRVVQLMQTPHGVHAPPQPGQYHPDVKQAVEKILGEQEKKG